MTAGIRDPVNAEIPDALRYSLYAPKTEPQAFEQQGHCVAAALGKVAVGVPLYDFNETNLLDCGVVKIYDAANGNLLHILAKPDPSAFEHFGSAVAISGSIVVVSASSDTTGSPYSGSVYVFDLASATPNVPKFILNNPSPGDYDQFGHSIAIDGNRVAVGAWLDDTDALNSGRVYVYDLSLPNPEVPTLVLVNPATAENDCFGSAVAISGDRLVASAYQNDTGAPNAGKAYVYNLLSGTPATPVLGIANPDPDSNDCFGTSLAISGSLAVIGAELDDVAGIGNTGSVYVFDLASPTAAVPVLSLSNPSPDVNDIQDCFGTSVSISGDVFVIGAYQDDEAGYNMGIAYVYNSTGALVTTLIPPPPEEPEIFGNSVAISGSTVVVGARLDDSGKENAGSTYVFDISSPTPAAVVATLDNPVDTSPDQFGNAVAVSGDLVAIGASLAENGATGAGRVNIYDLSSVKPTIPVATLENPVPGVGDRFGIAVAISGRLLLVGANGDDTGAGDAGSAYLYDLGSDTPSVPIRSFHNPQPNPDDGFGSSVAISGDYAVIGVPGDDAGAGNAGRAFLYQLTGVAPTVPIAILGKPTPAAEDGMGSSVAIAGDRVLAGVPGDDTGAAAAGCVLVFDLTGALVLTVSNPGPAIEDRFGMSVAISGSRVVVGAGGDDTGSSNAGSADVFDLGSGTPTVPFVTLANPTPAAEDQFGFSVSVSGPLVMIGAPFDDTGSTNAGRAYLFDVSGSSSGTPSGSLGKSTTTSEDRFGTAVAIDGQIVVIGTPLDNKTAADKGAAYVFGPSAPEIVAEGPTEIDLIDGASSHDFAAAAIGTNDGPATFKISNTGVSMLNIASVSVTGGNAADFTVFLNGFDSTIAASDDSSFTVAFTPPVAGTRTTTLRIVSNDGDENPFEVSLNGRGLSAADDTDGDGLNDKAELQLAALGFDWNSNQDTLVDTFFETAGSAGFYLGSQVHALEIPAPFLQRTMPGNVVKLTFDLKKSVNLTDYVPHTLGSGQTDINPQGELEFRFIAPDAALLRLEPK